MIKRLMLYLAVRGLALDRRIDNEYLKNLAYWDSPKGHFAAEALKMRAARNIEVSVAEARMRFIGSLR